MHLYLDNLEPNNPRTAPGHARTSSRPCTAVKHNHIETLYPYAVKILYSEEVIRAVSAQVHLDGSSQARRPHTRTSNTQRERCMHTCTQDVIIHIDLAVICLEPYSPRTGNRK